MTLFRERVGQLERDVENSYLQLDDIEEDPMQQLLGCSVSFCIAIGPKLRCKMFTLQAMTVDEDGDQFAWVGKESSTACMLA
jgi:hypothetical protein